MPIEIKELNIKAYIDNSTAPANDQVMDTNSTNAMETIIAACVEQVLQIIKDKEER